MARGARRIRSNNAPRNDPHKYSMEQAASAGRQLMTLPLKAYELAVVQPRDSQDWMSGMRRAVNLCGTVMGRSASNVWKHQGPGYERPGLPRRAETYGSFDASKEAGLEGRVCKRMSKDGRPGPLLVQLEPGQQAAAVQLTHHLNPVMGLISETFTPLEGFKVELAEGKERDGRGWARYKHNQQLEDLGIKQEQLVVVRRSWDKHR